jgi:hypothetical protein
MSLYSKIYLISARPSECGSKLHTHVEQHAQLDIFWGSASSTEDTAKNGKMISE